MRTGQDWYIVSLTQRQADATFAKCLKVARTFKPGSSRARMGESDFEARDKWIDQKFVFTAREIVFPNGGRVVSLPGRDPDTLAGLTGNVIFTEFGLFPGGGYDHWGVVFPLTTRGYKVIVISTPRGKNTKFYELWSATPGRTASTPATSTRASSGRASSSRTSSATRPRSRRSAGSTTTRRSGRASTSASSPATWRR
jgi:phage FluMu gp28-like protein